MTEHVVKDIGLFDVIELMRLADEVAGGKAAIGQVFEKDLVGHQPRHRHNLPAGALQQQV